MTPDQKASEIYRCALTALTPLMDGNADYAAELLKLQHRRLQTQRASQLLGEAVELAPVLQETLGESKGEMDTQDEKLQILGMRTLGAPDINVMNGLTQAVAMGFCHALDRAVSTQEWAERQTEKGGELSVREIRSFTGRMGVDMRTPVENAAKWLEAAMLIAKSDTELTADAAFVQAQRNRAG